MDVILYSLLNSELENQAESKTWNGFKIEVVDELPQTQQHNTIYLVKSKVMVGED